MSELRNREQRFDDLGLPQADADGCPGYVAVHGAE